MLAIKWKNSFLLCLTALVLLAGWSATTVSYFRLFNRDGGHYSYSMKKDGQELISAINEQQFLKKVLKQEIQPDAVSIESVQDYFEANKLGSQVETIINQYSRQMDQTQDTEKIKQLNEKKDENIKQLLDNKGNVELAKKEIALEQSKLLRKESKRYDEKVKFRLDFLKNNFWVYAKGADGQVVTNISKASVSDAEILNYMNKNGQKSQKIKVTIPLPLKEIENQLNEESRYGNQNAQVVDLYAKNLPDQIFTGYIALKNNGEIVREQENQEMLLKVGKTVFRLGIVLLLLGIGLLISFIRQETVDSKIQYRLLNMPLDFRFFLFLIVSVWALVSPITININRYQLALSNLKYSLFWMMIGYLMSVTAIVLLKNLWWSIKGRKGSPSFKEQRQQMLFARLFSWYQLKSLKEKRNWLILILFFLVIVGCVAFPLWLLIPILLIWSYWYLFRQSEQLIMRTNQVLANYQFNNFGAKTFSEAQQNIDEIDRIISKSEQITNRSENLKTELLTNVGHDLRTPLTSIISYGDLLTNDKISEADRTEYIQIINQKAQRMKKLIESLFEVTKMNHGDVLLHLSEVDLGQLIQQAIAEYSEELEQKNLKMCYDKPTEPLLLQLDGEKIWRVFDNVMGNIVKYAMPGTRVYLKIQQKEQQVMIQLKNISEYALNEDGSTLVERFKRGDTSRHSEGSGLGLAIVNSIISLHGGSLDIQIDGDLFKIILLLPMTDQEKEKHES